MTDHDHSTTDESISRRRALRIGSVAAAFAAAGATGIGGVAARGSDDSREFGRIWVRGEQWRTHVVTDRDGVPESYDPLFSVFDEDGEGLQASTSPYGPGDREYSGGQWVRRAVVITDEDAYDDVAPFESTQEAKDFVDAYPDAAKIVEDRDYIRDELGVEYVTFNCPLNGRAKD